MNKKPDIWQNHHISRDPEILAVVTRSEHYYLSRLNFFKSLSRGFRVAMQAIMDTKPVREKEE